MSDTPLRVLLIEDSPDDMDMVARELRNNGYAADLHRIESPSELADALIGGPWDVIISDYHLPRLEAPQALAAVQQRNLDIPFIVLTGTIGEHRAAAIMKAGASDFILKDQMGRLGEAIRRELRDVAARDERRRLSSSVENVNRELAELINASPLAIITLGKGWFVKRWSAAAAKLFGWSAAEVEGKILPTVPPSGQIEFTVMINDVRRGGTFAAVEMQWRRKDGSHVEVSLSMAPLHGAGQAIEGVVVLAGDMTERKRLEDQLQQTQKMEVVGKVAGGIAHDFNNLLTVINGRCQMVLARIVDNGAMRRDAELILETGERAARLTRQLLAFSRRQVFQLKELDVNRAVTDLRKLLITMIGERIELVTQLYHGLPAIRTDASQFEQMVLNLVVNARDAMPDGGRLSITTAMATLDEVRQIGAMVGVPLIKLAVADTGIGMDERTVARLFEPFFTTKPQGTGLGLSTVDSMVQQSKGFIRVDSAPGKGSTFSLFFPATTASSRDDESSHLRPAVSLRQRTILVVEDNDDVRDVVHDALSGQGHRVITAGDWPQALTAMESRTADIDLLLTDLVLPKVSGREVAARLLRLCPRMKVLYMSGYNEEVLAGQQAAGGLDLTLIQKPFTPHKLAKMVERLFRESDPA